MTKVFAIHYFDLKPGASAEELDQLLAANPFPTLPGWKTYYVKGDRGERTGKYGLIHEFDSIEIRDLYFPTENGDPNPDVQKLFTDPKQQALGPEFERLVTGGGVAVHTDYVLIE
jgi:hypothetical protein